MRFHVFITDVDESEYSLYTHSIKTELQVICEALLRPHK